MYDIYIELLCDLGGSMWLWIGGSDTLNLDDIHRWLDKTPVSSAYTNWWSSNPHNGNENWMSIQLSGGQWCDANNHNHNYICESGLI